MSKLKLTPSKRKEFEEGKPIIVNDTSEAMEIEHQLSTYFKLKWGGEERLGFHRIDIRKEDYPIKLFKEGDSLWWDNHKEE